MSDIVQTARTARERLAQALALLQGPEAGHLIDLIAPPVAQAMGALHLLESSGGSAISDAAPMALASVQRALAELQKVPSDNPVVEEATAYVAGSLGLLHALQQSASKPTTAALSGAHGFDRTAVSRDAPDYSEAEKKAERQRIEVALASTARPMQSPVPREPSPPAIAEGSPVPAPGATVEPRPAPLTTSQPLLRDTAPPSVVADSKHAAPPTAGRPPGSVLVEANLGAHSNTNFYKGLSGNDVIDDGGIFIATYDIPKPGTPLWVRVSLPGGYEFEAAGAVRWVREAGAGDAPPGFGAVFLKLSQEARALVYRYVRNREPIFYDDI